MPDAQVLARLKVIVARQMVQAHDHNNEGKIQESLLKPHLQATVEFQPPSPPVQETSGTTSPSKEVWAIIPKPSANGSVLWAFSDTDAGYILLKLWVEELVALEFEGGENYRAALAAIEHEYMIVHTALRTEGIELPVQGVQTNTGNSPASSVLGCIFGSIIAVVVVGALIGGLIGLGYDFGRNASTSPGNNTNGNINVTTGGQIYATSAPGECDQQGGSWTPNSHALQTCTSDGLILAGPNCPCPLGVVALTSIPSQAYPQDFVAQVTVQSLGTDPTAFWGFKFRQQSADDAGNGRGGYAFLLAQNGQWQFNLYDADGTRHILDSGNVSSALASTNTVEIMLNGASFSFYVNGQLIAQETDQTYSQGVLCLAAEPGARQLFKDFTLSTEQ